MTIIPGLALTAVVLILSLLVWVGLNAADQQLAEQTISVQKWRRQRNTLGVMFIMGITFVLLIAAMLGEKAAAQ